MQIPYTVEEPLAALHRIVAPGSGLFKVTDEHDIHAHGIGAILCHHIVGVDHIAAGFGHFFAALAQDHAVAGAFVIRFFGRYHTEIIEEFVPETGIKQMERGVFHAAVVPIHGRPVLQRFLRSQRLIVVGIHIPQEIPAGSRPLRHGIGFTPGFSAAAGAGGIDPVGHFGKGTFTVVSGFVTLHIRQHQRKLVFGHALPAALVAPDHGDRLTPVALTGEYPVTQFEIRFRMADSLFRDPLFHGGDRFFHRHAVEKIRVDHDTGIVFQDEGFLHHIAALDNLDNRQAELGGKFPVALVVARHAHHDASAIAHEHIVRNKERDMRSGNGMHRFDPLEAHTGFVLAQFTALKIALAGGFSLISLHLIPVFDLILPRFQILMLRRHDHIGHAEESIAAGCVHGELIAVGGCEIHLGPFAAADPVALLDLHTIDEIQIVQIVDQTVGIFGNAQHPLGLLLADDRAAAALTHTFHHFFVGQNAFTAGAPVDGHGSFIGQAVLVKLQENPLGPFVVAGVGGVHHTVPIEGIAQHVQLLGKVLNIVVSHFGRMDVVFDRIILRR